jgi:DNA-binding CsgD family transcriptional regulator
MVQLDQLISPLCLTTREHEILEHVAVGASAKEAAHENIRLNIHAKNRAHVGDVRDAL